MLPITNAIQNLREQGKPCDAEALREAGALRDSNHLRIKDEYLARVLAGEEYLLFDGAMGTMLQEAGLAAGELPELLCLTNPQEVTTIHRAYVEAGSQVVTTNTFGANARTLGDAARVDEVFKAAVRHHDVRRGRAHVPGHKPSNRCYDACGPGRAGIGRELFAWPGGAAPHRARDGGRRVVSDYGASECGAPQDGRWAHGVRGDS